MLKRIQIQFAVPDIINRVTEVEIISRRNAPLHSSTLEVLIYEFTSLTIDS